MERQSSLIRLRLLQTMKIRNLKTNHLENPVGNALSPLTFSWVAESGSAGKQKSARVEIAKDPKFRDFVFDSGQRSDICSLAYYPGFNPAKRTRYFWRVKVIADNNERATGSAFFETGKMGEPWEAEWVTSSFNGDNKHFLVRKTFTLEEFSTGRAYCSALWHIRA
jgi:alpha-L-rhamnosidase